MSEPSADLQAEILAEIAARGPIPFARFMDLCLYHPRLGYYTRGIGGGGGRDYLTSSGLHHVFGTLVARQAEEMWVRAGRPRRFAFVELGPGEGRFARDVLEEAERSPGFAAALRYLLLERSPALRDRQALRLAGRTSVPVSWTSVEEIEREAPFEGCLFANEVLDAFPVHRVVGTPDGVREIHVAARDGLLRETLGPPSTDAIASFLEEAGIVLEYGQEVDLNLEAPRALARAVRLLSRGYVIVVDYGYEAGELYRPERRRGTLRAFHRHRIGEDYLLRPGEQDLTAHLDFSALTRAAARAGARRLGRTTQSRFLLSLGALECLPEPEPSRKPARRPEEAAARVRRLKEREALKELVLPDRMGERFHVLIFGVGGVPGDLAGLAEPWARAAASATAAAGAAPPPAAPPLPDART